VPGLAIWRAAGHRHALAPSTSRRQRRPVRAGPQAVYDQVGRLRRLAASADDAAAQPYEPSQLGAPAPAPRQSFGIGLN